MKKIFIAAAVALTIIGGTACSNTTQEGESTVKSETAASQDTTGTKAADVSTEMFAYICPMKCEGSASNEPGQCPVCGMDLVENPDFRPDTETLK